MPQPRAKTTPRDILHTGPELFLDNPSSGSRPCAELMSVAETAVFLTVSQRSIRRLQQARKLPFIKVGGSVRFNRSDLLAYLRQQRVRPLD